MAAITGQVSSNTVVLIRGVVGSGIDTNLDPGKDSILNRVSQVDVLREGVIRLISLKNRPHILLVAGHLDSVGVVRGKSLDFFTEVLGPEELSDVLNRAVVDLDCAVGRDRCIGVSEEMGMGSTSLVMTGEDGLKLNNTIVVGDLDTTKESGVQTSLGANAGVNTSGVAVPDVGGQVGDSIAGRYVDVLDLEEQRHSVTELCFDDVGSQVFADDVVRTSGDLGGQDTARVGAKDSFERSEHVVARDSGLVVVDSFPLDNIVFITAVLLGVY